MPPAGKNNLEKKQPLSETREEREIPTEGGGKEPSPKRGKLSFISLKALILILFPTLLVSLIVVYFWVCLALEKALKEEMTALVSRFEAGGVTVSYDKMGSAFLPFKSGVLIENTSFSYNGATWRAGKIIASIFPLNPFQVTVSLTGSHEFQRSPEETPLRLMAPNAALLIGVTKNKRVDFLFLNVEGVKSTDSTSFALDALSVFIRLEEEGLRYTAKAENIAFPGTLGKVLPEKTTLVSAQGILKSLTEQDLFLGFLDAWQTKGGALEITNFSMDNPAFSFAGEATLTTDNAMRPMFAGTFAMTNFFPFLQVLEKEKIIRRKDATVAKIVLSPLLRVDAMTGKTVIQTGVTFQSGRLYVGPVVLINFDGPKKIDNAPVLN